MPRRRRRARARVLALILVLLALFLLCGRERSWTIGTFNIRTFPGAETDPEAVARAIAELDADVFAVQEIIDIAAFDAVLERASALSGRRYQAALVPARCLRTDKLDLHVGVVHDARRFTRVGDEFLGDWSCPEGQPAGILAHLEDADARALVVASIHLRAGGSERSRDERAASWRWLLREVPAIEARFGAPVIVAGDFNSTGYLDPDDPDRRWIHDQIAAHARRLATGSLSCSMYWQPRRGDPYIVSLLDHVLVPAGIEVGEPEVLGMCAALACEPQATRPAAFAAVSDHCPVRVTVDP